MYLLIDLLTDKTIKEFKNLRQAEKFMKKIKLAPLPTQNIVGG
jgi:hypothetical protein